MQKKYLKISLVLLSSIVFLPGCKTDAKKNDGSRVLISVNSKPALTEQELESFIEQAVEANPQAKVMYTMMPEAIKEQAFEAKKQAIVMSEWAKKEGVRDSAEYKKKLNQVLEQIYNALDQEEFMKRHKGDISDQEIIAFYEEHKNEPQFTMNQAGVKVVGVEFKTKEEADKFAQELTGKAANVESIAKARKLDVKDFGVVSKDAFAPKAVKNAVENIKTFPSVKVVRDDKKHVVLVALAKEDAKLYPLEEIKDALRKMLEQKKAQDSLGKLADYQEKLNIKLDEQYREELKAQAESRQQQFKQQMETQNQQPQKAAHKEAHSVA